MNKTKKCKDCKWFTDGPTGLNHLARCACPMISGKEQDLVTGEGPQKSFCSIERSIDLNIFHLENFCGKEGKWFTQKEDKS